MSNAKERLFDTEKDRGRLFALTAGYRYGFYHRYQLFSRGMKYAETELFVYQLLALRVDAL